MTLSKTRFLSSTVRMMEFKRSMYLWIIDMWAIAVNCCCCCCHSIAIVGFSHLWCKQFIIHHHRRRKVYAEPNTGQEPAVPQCVIDCVLLLFCFNSISLFHYFNLLIFCRIVTFCVNVFQCFWKNVFQCLVGWFHINVNYVMKWDFYHQSEIDFVHHQYETFDCVEYQKTNCL